MKTAAKICFGDILSDSVLLPELILQKKPSKITTRNERMSNKHFYDNDLATLVRSLTAQDPEFLFDRKQKGMCGCAKHDPSTCVGLVSGGGAGLEPAHAAYVGEGMLTAAVSGNIFASPSVSQIVATIRQIAGPAGTILIVKTAPEDFFHFSLGS